MRITEFSLRNPLVVCGVATALCLFGLFAYFTLGVAVTTDRPEHASAFSGLVRMGQTFAENMLREAASKSRGADAARAREGLAMLSSAVNRAEGDTLFLRVSVPQKTIIKLINDERAKGVKKPIRKPRRRARRR